jgi:hypothetical protein
MKLAQERIYRLQVKRLRLNLIFAQIVITIWATVIVSLLAIFPVGSYNYKVLDYLVSAFVIIVYSIILVGHASIHL